MGSWSILVWRRIKYVSEIKKKNAKKEKIRFDQKRKAEREKKKNKIFLLGFHFSKKQTREEKRTKRKYDKNAKEKKKHLHFFCTVTVVGFNSFFLVSFLFFFSLLFSFSLFQLLIMSIRFVNIMEAELILGEDWSPEVNDLLTQLIERDPAKRLKDANEMKVSFLVFFPLSILPFSPSFYPSFSLDFVLFQKGNKSKT